jgi:hypothetical protein
MSTFRIAALTTAIVAASAMTPSFAQHTASGQQMPGTTTQQSGSPDDATVHKVGTALRNVATIRQQYAQRIQSTDSPQQRQELTDQARTDMEKAIGDQGLTIDRYSQVIQMAQNDPTLRQRVLSAAQSGG